MKNLKLLYPNIGYDTKLHSEAHKPQNQLNRVTSEYPATLTALLKNHGYLVRSVWGNNLKCSKAVLGAGYAVHGTQ